LLASSHLRTQRHWKGLSPQWWSISHIKSATLTCCLRVIFLHCILLVIQGDNGVYGRIVNGIR
jgi:hypothetical protein